ncbi:hypothetical protein [Polaribacter sp. AHE13PA]|jgi:hypothetical protein|uniref:hypothetical protein n=1 Tax=Polaribacter sp. AHE13PA TaxID=2745562 RepID=UPI001C4FA90A|nr:hypothetical protein [Polaribacter sp. AHE13PA]QXP65771.1 hypothetical protein H0I28_11250 [Polaribacter sp. AHE13PA]
MKRLLYILTIITLFNGCSKDDPIIELEESFIEGGTIKILSLVKISNDNINQEQYSGKIGDIDVLFYQTDEKELTFTVPSSSEIGENILEIPNLNNLKIKYKIIDTELQGTPEENISPYFTNADNYLLTANNSNNVKNYFENLNNYFQNASEDEKILMAKFYKANQNQFDAILNRDFLNKSSGKSSVDGEDVKILLKYVSAVLACGVGTAIAILNPEPVTKAIAAGIAIVAFDLAEDLKRDFANRNFLKLNVIIDGINSDLASKGLKKSELILYNEIEKPFALQSKSRALVNSDTDSNNSNISKFFSNQNIYNSTVEKINTAISFVNDKLFFSNISLLEISSLEDYKPELTENANSLFFSNAAFSIDSDNVNIDNISFDNEKLNIKVKIIDDSSVNEFIETKLNYSYEDDFNEINGSFPVKIYKNPDFELTGVWHLKHYDDSNRTSTSSTQITEIDFQNIRENLNISASYSDYVGLIIRSYNNNQWTTISDPYQGGQFWKQKYVANGNYISLTNTFFTNLEYRFYVDENNPDILIGESIGLSNNGLNKEIIKL